jgi:cytoskeletal protein CcmA (bactofilin family)
MFPKTVEAVFLALPKYLACRTLTELGIVERSDAAVPVPALQVFPASLRRTSMSAPLSADLAQIGKSVVIKGDLSGSEDLYVDGQVEGSISLKNNSLTVGPHGQIKASVEAKGVVVQGKLEGNVMASDRVELRKSAVVTGDISTQRISIEEGAYLKGKIDIQGRAEKAAGK